ncbi:hypothetical protein SB6423_04919 [Klebsiella pasteurii]|uniref:hypothetical protein n=1 Tax=Klebsiella pasteurii TaxID=2587529 RepID=UPI001156D462|nr:hypothetical protein [Klebsiella pasteurii]VUS45351.1 hypothetical protein SB6423_04919 [Klebsiella pasteurii]
MADWFIATEGVKVVKDSASLWPQIITAVSSISAALGGVSLTHHYTRKREERAAAAKLESERLYISTGLVFLLERFAQRCAPAATAAVEYDQDGRGETEFLLPEIDYSSVSGNWRSLPSGLMYRLSELSVLSHEAVVCVDNEFVEDTPYGGAGEYSLHKNAAMLGVKALRLSRELRMLCGLPLHGISYTLSPTRLVLLKVRGKKLQKEYEIVKKHKKNEQEIDDFIKGTS